MVRSHGAYLAATMLALSGAASDVPMLLRGSLEYALYCLHADRSPRATELWLRRMESADARRAARKEFTTKRLWQTLEAIDARKCEIVKIAYEETIEYGAHPSIGALATTLKVTDRGDATILTHACLAADPLSRVSCFTMTANIGLYDLLVLEATYPRQFQELGLSRKFAALQAEFGAVGPARLRREGIIEDSLGSGEAEQSE